MVLFVNSKMAFDCCHALCTFCY